MDSLFLLPFLIICNLFPMLLTLVATGFWIWMLIDLVQRDFPKNRENEKVIWIVLLVFTHLIGALIYLFVVKNGEEYQK